MLTTSEFLPKPEEIKLKKPSGHTKRLARKLSLEWVEKMKEQIKTLPNLSLVDKLEDKQNAGISVVARQRGKR